MALAKGTNSYITVSEADTYFETRLDVAAWNDAPPEMKEQALVTATQYLDGLTWLGYASDETQKLAFPRYGTYFEPRLGLLRELSSVTATQRIETATCELAYHLLNNDGLFDDTGSADSISLGGISLSKLRPSSKLPESVRRYTKPLMQTSNSRAWWRSN